jgi:glycosyltransferase involved in cell wall biosynthesis
MENRRPLRMAHVVDALDVSGQLWGKERVVAQLMREQRASGRVIPRLITFGPGRLFDEMANDGFETVALGRRGVGGTYACMRQLMRNLARSPVAVVHSHGYKANLVVRALRALGQVRNTRIVSTCHGWDPIDAKLRIYNAVDRWTTGLSDVTTVPDPNMLFALPRRARTRYVPNGIADAVVPVGPDANAAAPVLPRTDGSMYVGTMGRLTHFKGIPEVLEAARRCASDPAISFAVAGAGELVETVQASPDVHYVGYLAESAPYVSALDVYLQASHTEGLSLSLLEAMRAGKAIIATDVGATRDAVSEESAIIIQPGDPQAIVDAVEVMKDDPARRAALGRAARARFEAEFRADRPHSRFLELYEAGRSV